MRIRIVNNISPDRVTECFFILAVLENSKAAVLIISS